MLITTNIHNNVQNFIQQSVKHSSRSPPASPWQCLIQNGILVKLLMRKPDSKQVPQAKVSTIHCLFEELLLFKMQGTKI